MKLYENPKCYYDTIKTTGQVLAIWPSKIGASKIELLLHKIKWWISFLIITSLVTPLILGGYYFRNDSVAMTKVLSELTAVIEFFLNLIQCKIQNYNFQVILDEMEYFIRNANEHEEQILQKYINRYKSIQQILGLSFIVTAISFVCMPIVTPQPLPADGWYPFSTEPYSIRIPLYILQVIAIAQVGSGFIVDFIIAAMLWFSAVKTELLQNQISKAKGKIDIKNCAYQHQLLILYTKRVEEGIKYIILKTNITMTMSIVCGAFQLIKHEPFEVVIRFMLMIIAGSLRLYVSAKPADDLKENSENLARSAFSTALGQQSPSDAKLALMLARRCQKPIVISVTGIVKAYCLEYYGLFLATAVKYTVNLRAILD